MAEIILKQIWSELTLKFTDDQQKVNEAWDEIRRCYGEPRRAYHTLEHIHALVELIEEYSPYIKDKPMLLFAAFYHDIVYVAGSSSNENDSAAIASARMKQLRVPDKMINETKELILQTRSHADVSPSVTQDMLLFLDMDLSILGVTPDTYRRYYQNVRKEFKSYPDLMFRQGRKSFLNSQLKRPYIFHTRQFRERYEATARVNMLSEMDELTQGKWF
jgi:predicted metal-dependent HD superfamily phosphohydrolase